MLCATHEVCIGANIQGKQIKNLRFADDIVLMAESADDLQVLVDRVQDSSCNFGLKINIAKTEVQAISKQKINLCITINGIQLKQVEEFAYLGGTISEGGSIKDYATLVMSKGWAQRGTQIWCWDHMYMDIDLGEDQPNVGRTV